MLPAASVAEHVTVLVPSAKVLPDATSVVPTLQVTGSTPETASLALALNVTAAPLGPVASAMMSAGTVTTGSVVSWTVMVKLGLPVLPALAVAEHSTVVFASGKVSPELASQVAASAPSTRSSAVASSKVTAAPLGPVASAMVAGGSRGGGV